MLKTENHQIICKGYPKTNVFNEALNQTRMEGSEINVLSH